MFLSPFWCLNDIVRMMYAVRKHDWRRHPPLHTNRPISNNLYLRFMNWRSVCVFLVDVFLASYHNILNELCKNVYIINIKFILFWICIFKKFTKRRGFFLFLITYICKIGIRNVTSNRERFLVDKKKSNTLKTVVRLLECMYLLWDDIKTHTILSNKLMPPIVPCSKLTWA